MFSYKYNDNHFPLMSCLHHITPNVNGNYRWKRTKALKTNTPIKLNHQFILLELLVSSHKIKQHRKCNHSSDHHGGQHPKFYSQHPEFYSQQLVLIILWNQRPKQTREKIMWPYLLRRKSSQCTLRQILD